MVPVSKQPNGFYHFFPLKKSFLQCHTSSTEHRHDFSLLTWKLVTKGKTSEVSNNANNNT